jgi:Type IV secretion system pilin
MIKKFRTLIVSLSLMLSLLWPALALPSMVYATTTQSDINKGLCQGSNIDVTTSTPTTDCSKLGGGASFTSILTKIINILSMLVGAIAVIMIIVGGFRYVTSGGSDSATGAAKKTILYAIVGLVIVALAQIIVHFVLNNITS